MLVYQRLPISSTFAMLQQLRDARCRTSLFFLVDVTDAAFFCENRPQLETVGNNGVFSTTWRCFTQQNRVVMGFIAGFIGDVYDI